MGFRHLLVHEYLDIDRRIVHRVPRENLEALGRVFARFL
ncbi:HepT-like ribonuclease domain-containing protein [Thermus arciformis]|nr:HepT-like ribonuclease domain-containing protein [Thermus arciformis]